MLNHIKTNVLLVTKNEVELAPLTNWLLQTATNLEITEQLPMTLSSVDVLLIDVALTDMEWGQVQRYGQRGGHMIVLAQPHVGQVPTWTGVQVAPRLRDCEVRILFSDVNNELTTRFTDAFYVSGSFLPLTTEGVTEPATTILYADWQYKHLPVLTQKQVGEGSVLVTTLRDFKRLALRRFLYRLIRQLNGRFATKTLNVGILGYAPSVGQLHGMGAAATEGLALRMACDLSQKRLAIAKEQFPSVITTDSSQALQFDPNIDVVIIATPPSSHKALAMEMLTAGKHVICEKPLALSVAEVDAMRELAAKQGVHISCHQNRRWDNDYLAIRNAVNAGWLGEPFYLETFIGGYGHPCGYWHSEESVSGGTTFDWGAHYLDWMLDLMPGEIAEVIGTRHNRAWHDITNADQERIQLRYADGRESEFTHSDLVFIPKPKWYFSGTEGTIIGQWREVSTYDVDPIIYYHQHDIPPSELGADLTLRRQTVGGIIEQNLPTPSKVAYPFHSNLADYLLLGEPLTVPFDHSARVVAVLEAAKRSAENNGRIEAVRI